MFNCNFQQNRAMSFLLQNRTHLILLNLDGMYVTHFDMNVKFLRFSQKYDLYELCLFKLK